MKTSTKPTLELRAQSIRKLTANQLRLASGGNTSGHRALPPDPC